MSNIDARGESRPPGRTDSPGVPVGKADQEAIVLREPGWYRDPEQPRRHRYWDGRDWLPQGPALRGPGQLGTTAPVGDLPRPRRGAD